MRKRKLILFASTGDAKWCHGWNWANNFFCGVVISSSTIFRKLITYSDAGRAFFDWCVDWRVSNIDAIVYTMRAHAHKYSICCLWIGFLMNVSAGGITAQWRAICIPFTCVLVTADISFSKSELDELLPLSQWTRDALALARRLSTTVRT